MPDRPPLMERRWFLPLVLAAALALAVGGIVWEVRRRDPSVQVPACFVRLSEAVRDHDATALLSCVHRDYPFVQMFPRLFPEAATARSTAGRLLTQAFLMARDERLDLEASLGPVEMLADGRAQVRVSLRVRGRPFAQAVPELTGHRFILARGSLVTGRWRIVGHDPFTLRPEDGFP